MSELKTQVNNSSVTDYINAVEDLQKRDDTFELLKIYQEITQQPAKMWGTSIIGFGQYHYKSERSSQEGDWLLAGFSPRKQNLTIYVMTGFGNLEKLLSELGKHKVSKGCLYINKLSDVNIGVLEKLIATAFAEAKARFTP